MADDVGKSADPLVAGAGTMSDARLFDVPAHETEAVVTLSAGQRRTARQRDLIAAGVHPATKRPIVANGHRCGDCVHRNTVTHYSSHLRQWHKCANHYLGESHSDASDIRLSWPACDMWEATP